MTPSQRAGAPGEVLLWGTAGGGNAPDVSGLTLPAGWVKDDVFILTPLPDFLGARTMLKELAASLKPWTTWPLTLTAHTGGPGLEDGRTAAALADAVISLATRGAHVLVVSAGSPWNDPVGRALIQAHLWQGGDRQAESPVRSRSFSLHVVENGGAPRILAQTPLDRLEAIMVRLLAPGGCPWDREQTHLTLRPYVVEEAAEVIEAIERGTPGKLVDELGDLLLQIAFHAALASETGDFALADVARAIEAKMLFRHPHVFSDWQVSGAEEVLHNWDVIKASEAAAAGETADRGAWRPLRKAAVRVSLAAIRAAFAAAGDDDQGFKAARRDLADQVAALLAGAQDSLGTNR